MKDLLKITKARLSNHFHYSKWHYVVAIAAALVIVSIVLTMTEPRYPDENRISIIIYGATMDEAIAAEWEDEMLEFLSEDQREVEISSTVTVDELTQTVVMARIAAKEDNIVIMDIENISLYAASGAFLPLDEYMDLEGIFSMYPDVNWDEYYTRGIENEEQTSHIYWLPLYVVEGYEYIGASGDGAGIAVFSNSANISNALICVEYIMTLR